MFNSTPDDLDMHLIYDVSHNIAKMEEHLVDGQRKRLLGKSYKIEGFMI